MALHHYLGRTLIRSMRLFFAIAKIMVPVMLAVQIAQQVGLVDLLGRALEPAMQLLNLPAEAAIIWATTMLTGIYGGIASMAGLSAGMDLNAGQLSALAAMMLIAHNIPVEQSIVRRAGASFAITGGIRVVTATLYGAIVAWLSHITGWLSEPIDLGWLRGSELVGNASEALYWLWLQSTAYTLALTYAVIVGLVVVLDAFDRLGITQRITVAITPLLRLSGLNPQAAPVTTVGVLLGLSYGGALIIEESERQGFSVRTRFLALSWLSLCHALIEDTLLLAAVGANLWVIVVGRILITLAVIALLARLTRPGARLALAETPG